MTKREDGGPAFPITPDNEPRMNGMGGRGMTLRDWFATVADHDELSDIAFRRISRSAGEVLAGPYPNEPRNGTVSERVRWQLDCAAWDCRVRAAIRYQFADAMLKAREVSHEA